MHMNRNSGMRDLAFHYDAVKRAYPEDKLMIVFDIDGILMDFRSAALSALQEYDHAHGTMFFNNLICNDIPAGPRDIAGLLKEFALSPREREEIAGWYEANFWRTAFRNGMQKPFHGVMDVIRWFQLQPNTFVGLISGCSEEYRSRTLDALSCMGEEYRVAFSDALLSLNHGLMNPESKVQALRYFQECGYRIMAVMESENESLKAISETMQAKEILLLHADSRCCSGCSADETVKLFDLTELIGEQQIPGHIALVWHGVDDEPTLRSFLVSSVHWAEMHVRLDMKGEDLIVRRKRLTELPPWPGEHLSRLEDFLYILSDTGRGVKLDLKDPGMTGRVIGMLKNLGFSEERVWITMNREEVEKGELQLVMKEFPGAVKQFPVDSLWEMMDTSPEQALSRLKDLAVRGIGRFSVDWKTPECRRIIVRLQQWGFRVNIYNVPDLESFLQASLLLPESITSYFNFPKWFYTGKSSEDEEHLQSMPPIRLRRVG